MECKPLRSCVSTIMFRMVESAIIIYVLGLTHYQFRYFKCISVLRDSASGVWF